MIIIYLLFSHSDHKVLLSISMADVRYQEKCLAISIEKGDPLPISEAYETLGDTYCDLGEYGKAIGYFEKGLEIAADEGF